MRKVAFTGGQVFDTQNEVFVSSDILCDDGYITDITCGEIPYGYEIIDVSGKYIIPGLVDVHTHGIGGYDFNKADENAIAKMALCYARKGTTSVMATLASQTMSRLIDSVFNINQYRLHQRNGCAGVLGVHLEGRYLNPEKRGCHDLELLANPNTEELNSLAYSMMPPPMHFSIAPELPGADQFIKKAVEYGATVGIAHTCATYEQAQRAVGLGATSFTHTFNAMPSIHHRKPGAAVCSLNSDISYTEIICDGLHVHPAMIRLAYKAKPKNKLVIITDSMMATCCPDGEYQIAGTKVYVRDGVAEDENGTLAGSTSTLFEGLKNLMKFCNISLNEAIKYATKNPAEMVHADFVGSIAKCNRADFITLSDISNPEIDDIYIGASKVIK